MSSLLALFAAEHEDEAFDLFEEMQRRASNRGWEPLLVEAFALLSSRAQEGYWNEATLVIYWSLSAQPTLPCTREECIARLYVCLEQSPELDENLVWSVAKELKGVPYVSDWDPYKDPVIWEHMERYR